MITANQPFGEWNRVFPDPAMTLAAVDRLVHHATIFEMNVESYRRRSAIEAKRQRGRPASYATIKSTHKLVAERQSENDESLASHPDRRAIGIRPATGGRPGDGNRARPERCDRRFPMLIATSFVQVLRRPLESASRSLVGTVQQAVGRAPAPKSP